jgi:nucleotide-binding universal stress UspA family protein
MSIKTMLVHVDDGAHSPARVDTAVRLARDVGARLVGAYLVPTGDVYPSVAALMPKELVDQRLREGAAAQKAAELAFRDGAARGGLDRIEWRAPAGDAFQAIVEHGRFVDLVVLGQRDPDDRLGPFASELATTALLGLGRPILLVPYRGAKATLGERILVATDGGREAARAIADAMPLIERASQVHVLIGSPGNADQFPTFAQSSARLGGWLRDHGVEAVLERYDIAPGDKGEWLLSRAADHGSDLIVMGGYGHSRVREIVLGGMTRTILGAMTVPVLMSH